MLNLVFQISTWIVQLVAGFFAGLLLVRQVADEAHEDGRQDDEQKLLSGGVFLGISLLFGGLTILSSLPGFLWGGNWTLLPLVVILLAVIFQLAASADRSLPLIVVVLASGIGGFIPALSTNASFKILGIVVSDALTIAVITVIVAVGLVFLGDISEEPEGEEVD